jgi:hypothetical protein
MSGITFGVCISVDERLPDSDTEEWFLVRYALANAYSLPLIAELVDGEWYEQHSRSSRVINNGRSIEHYGGTTIEINRGVKITHWMRIPD